MKAKLVRDKIPLLIKKSGRIPVMRIASKADYKKLLAEKIIEETSEFKKRPKKEELADILEASYSLIKAHGYNKNSIEKIRKNKNKERGSFNKRIVLMRVK